MKNATKRHAQGIARTSASSGEDVDPFESLGDPLGRVSLKPSSRPPARTRASEPRAGDIRSRILEAATRAFAGKGFDGASLQEIAQAVGIRKASLLYHYDSKEELHRSVLGELLSRWNEALPRLLRAASRDDRFDAILEETVAFFLADADRARLLLREVLDRPRQMRRLLATHASQWMGIVADTIRKAQKAGTVRSDVDPEAYVLQVIHLVVGSISSWSATGVLLGARADRPPARLVRELIRVARTSLLSFGAEETNSVARSHSPQTLDHSPETLSNSPETPVDDPRGSESGAASRPDDPMASAHATTSDDSMSGDSTTFGDSTASVGSTPSDHAATSTDSTPPSEKNGTTTTAERSS